MRALVAILFALAGLSSAENQSSLTTNSSSRESCKLKYTPGCIEADMGGFFRLLAKAPPLELLPGVTVISSYDDKNSSAIDSLSAFLKSLTLRVAVYNEEALSYIYTLTSQPSSTGRGKKIKFLSIYTVFAIAFALLSALVGKAMTLSLVSLVMAMLTRNQLVTGNAPPASPVYDIVRRPQVNYNSEGFWATAGAEDANQDPEPPFPNPYEVPYYQPVEGQAREVLPPNKVQMAHTQTQEDVYEGAHSYPVGYVFPRVTSRSSHPYYAHTPKVPTEPPLDNVETTSAIN